MKDQPEADFVLLTCIMTNQYKNIITLNLFFVVVCFVLLGDSKIVQ